MDLRRMCNVVYAYISQGMEEAERAKLDAILEGRVAPGPGARASAPARVDTTGMRALQQAMMMPTAARA